MRLLSTFLVLPLATAALTLAAPAALGCAGGTYHSGTDPVYEYHYGWDRDGCFAGSGAGDCDVQEIASVGDPVRSSEYPVGVYAFTCDEGTGPHTEWEASSESDVVAAQCQPVPRVSVLGQQVPGTGETHCSPPVRPDVHETVGDPDALPQAGVFVMFPDPTDPSGYSYVVLSTSESSRCIGAGEVGSTPVTLGVVEIGETTVRYGNCAYGSA